MPPKIITDSEGALCTVLYVYLRHSGSFYVIEGRDGAPEIGFGERLARYVMFFVVFCMLLRDQFKRGTRVRVKR